MKDEDYVLMNKEIEELANYMKMVKRIFFGAIVIIIVMFAFFFIFYGPDLFSNFLVTGLFISSIIILYLLSIILLFRFRRKVRKLRDKL